MSDDVAKAGAEDVLSSIRRLVSDEGTVRSVSARSDQADEDRLVLTPALRVPPAGDSSASEDDLGQSAATDEPAGAGDPPVTTSLESTIAELESAVGGQTDFEPDGGEDSTVLDYPPSLLREARELADRPLPGPRRRLTLGLSEGAEPGGADTDGESLAETPPVAEAPAPQRPPERPGTLRLVSPVSEPGPAEEHVEDHAQEPVGADRWAAAPAPEASSGAADALDDVEEVLLDEDALREMVAEIVREELRGSLGEQITANIRKLIRREIHDYFDVSDNE